MKLKNIFLVGALMLAACQSGEPVGYVRLALPSFDSLAESRGPSAVFGPAAVNTWTVTVSGEDMDEPVVVTTTETELTVQVKAGPQRLVHVAARAPEVEGVSQGFDGETVVDVPEQGNAVAVVDVYRSVTVSDTNAPTDRNGLPAAPTAPDVQSLTLTLGADAMHVFLTFANTVAAPWNARENAIRGLIELDLDRNAQTGAVSLVQARSQRVRAAGQGSAEAPIGAEVAIDLSPASQGYVRLVSNQTSKPIASAFGAGVLSVTVPYADLGGQPQALRLAAMILDKAGNSDFLPERDYIEIAILPTPAPEGELPVTSFVRNFVSSVVSESDWWGDYYYPPAVALVRGAGGLHAAWTKAGGVEYAFSEDGERFPVRRTLPAQTHYSFVDMTVDEKGNPVLAVTTQYFANSEAPEAQTLLYWGQGTNLGAPVKTEVMYDYAVGSQVAVLGASAYVLPSPEYGTPELVRISGGAIAAMSAPEFQIGYEDYTVTATPGGVVLSAWDPWGSGMDTFNVSESLGLAASKGAALPGDNGFAYDFSVDGAGGVLFAAYSDWSGGLFISGTNGAQYALANVSALASGYSRELIQPQIAVSGSGRIGVVWYAIPGMVEVPRAPALVALPGGSGSGPAGFYYAELLPGANAFGPSLYLGDGDQAALAFDATGKPVVLVGASIFNEFGEATSRAEIHVYRGK